MNDPMLQIPSNVYAVQVAAWIVVAFAAFLAGYFKGRYDEGARRGK